MGLRLDLDDGTLPFHCRTTIKNHRYQWKTIGKPSENYCCQWFSCEKTFNGNGREVTKPLENHRWQWCPEKIILPSHRLKKMTIVEVYIVLGF